MFLWFFSTFKGKKVKIFLEILCFGPPTRTILDFWIFVFFKYYSIIQIAFSILKIVYISWEIMEMGNIRLNLHFCEDFIENLFLEKKLEHLTFWHPTTGCSFLTKIAEKVVHYGFWVEIAISEVCLDKGKKRFPKDFKSQKSFSWLRNVWKNVFTCFWKKKQNIFFSTDDPLFFAPILILFF